jgi:hypothetical protein
LSVAVDLGFGADLALQNKLKINFKGDGQECPSYTSCRLYCPLNSKIGFCWGKELDVVPMPNGVTRSSSSVSSGMFDPGLLMLLSVVLMMATDPASQTLT